MKYARIVLALSLGLAATGTPAHGYEHGRVRFGVFVGAPVYGPWYYPPYPYVAPVVVQTPQPEVYVQQPAAQNYWYFCRSANGYYPYVQTCPEGWQPVPPQPPQPPAHP